MMVFFYFRPNVCKSRHDHRNYCCPGWTLKVSTGLCVVRKYLFLARRKSFKVINNKVENPCYAFCVIIFIKDFYDFFDIIRKLANKRKIKIFLKKNHFGTVGKFFYIHFRNDSHRPHATQSNLYEINFFFIFYLWREKRGKKKKKEK